MLTKGDYVSSKDLSKSEFPSPFDLIVEAMILDERFWNATKKDYWQKIKNLFESLNVGLDRKELAKKMNVFI